MRDQDSKSSPLPPTLPTGAAANPFPADSGSARALGPSEDILAPGALLGRYIVHRVLGMGGAGVVYAAHDPELDRTVALKVLRRRLTDRGEGPARFLREAQALARLSHPNVITVYDVGSADGRTFIAMEYIHGQTFAEWLASSDSDWSAILAVLVKAGRGLAAAHHAGLIHRDFKPGNLLVSLDGRVVVTDFGLARAVMGTEPELAAPQEHAHRLDRGSAFARSITCSGAVLGTPAYMAPEQQQGEPSDARADQFSFCVTLYEALFREHPLLHSSSPPPSGVAGVQSAPARDLQGKELVACVPNNMHRVPPWLRRAVLRGLSWSADERFPSMDSLLTTLTREPVRRRRRVRLGLAAAGLVAGAVGVGLAMPGDPQPESCTGAREQLSAVWNPAVGAQVRTAFAATGRPHAPSSAARAGELFDVYAGRWADMHRSACLAGMRGEQSPDLLDRRMTCLGRRLAQFGALLELFVQRADGKVVDSASDLAAALEPVATCADSAALLSRVAPPSDARVRARVVELEGQTERADIERQAGRPQAAADGARAVLEAERALDYDPLAAHAGRVLGRSLEDLGRPAEARQALIDAQRRAEAAGDTKLAAHLMLDLLVVVNVREKRVREAQLLAQLVEVALERPELQGDQELRVRLLAALGSMANDEGNADRAVELQREALAIRRRISPPVSLEVANAEQSLGNALRGRASYDEARAHYLQTLTIRRQILGDQHPLVANIHVNLGVTAIEKSGQASEARGHFLAALAILERVPGYRSYPTVLANLAALELKVGNLDQALGYQEAALAAFQRQYGLDHPDVATSLLDLGSLRRQMGAFAEALALHRRALALYEKTTGTDHPSYAVTVSEIGEDLRRLGRTAEALKHQERALHVLGARVSEYPMIGYQLAYKGLALVDLGRRQQAIPVLEQALQKLPPGDPDRARAGFALARALEPRQPRSPRTKALTREALEIFAAVRASDERDQVAAYLARGSRQRPRGRQ